MSKVAVIGAGIIGVCIAHFSGYGHTKKVAEFVADGANAQLIAIDENGDIKDTDWDALNNADAIIFGAPTYMGSYPWQFKKFVDATSKVWFTMGWKDKVFGGFTNSGSLNGDKQVTLISMQTLASQHGGIWVSLGLPPANKLESTRQDINNLGGSVGVLVQSPTDADETAIPSGDLETARLYGERVAEIAKRLK